MGNHLPFFMGRNWTLLGIVVEAAEEGFMGTIRVVTAFIIGLVLIFQHSRPAVYASYIVKNRIIRILRFWTTLSLGHREDCFCRRAVGVSLPDGILRRLALFV